MEFAQFRLGQLLGNLRFHLIQWRQLCFTHVIDTNDVKAELALDRGLSELAFFKLDHGIGKLRDVTGCTGPIQIATIGARAWVFRSFLRQVFKFATLFQVSNQGLGFVFFFNQDVTCTVFLAAIGRNKFVILAFDFGVGHRVFLLEVGKQLADQKALTGQLQLRFVVFAGV